MNLSVVHTSQIHAVIFCGDDVCRIYNTVMWHKSRRWRWLRSHRISISINLSIYLLIHLHFIILLLWNDASNKRYASYSNLLAYWTNHWRNSTILSCRWTTPKFSNIVMRTKLWWNLSGGMRSKVFHNIDDFFLVFHWCMYPCAPHFIFLYVVLGVFGMLSSNVTPKIY